MKLCTFPSKNSLTSCWIFGIRVEPPTSTNSLTSLFWSLASSSTCWRGIIVFWNRSWQERHKSKAYGLIFSPSLQFCKNNLKFLSKFWKAVDFICSLSYLLSSMKTFIKILTVFDDFTFFFSLFFLTWFCYLAMKKHDAPILPICVPSFFLSLHLRTNSCKII